MSQEKKDIWTIETVKTVLERVVFDEPVTADEAMALYAAEEYEDIIDSEDIGIGEVLGAK